MRATNVVLFLCIVMHWRLTTYLNLRHGSNNYFLREGLFSVTFIYICRIYVIYLQKQI